MQAGKFVYTLTLLSLALQGLALQSSLRAALDDGLKPRELGDLRDKLVERFKGLWDKNDPEIKNLDKYIFEGNECDSSEKTEEEKNYPLKACINGTENSIVIKFVSPSEIRELNLQGLTLDSKEISIDDYIKNFISHCKEQAVTFDQKIAKIAEGINNFMKSDNKVKLDSSKSSSGDFHITVNEESSPEELDMKFEDKDNNLRVKTNYFESDLTLSSENNEIIKDVEKVLSDSVKHLERTKRFALSEDKEDHHDKELNCETTLGIAKDMFADQEGFTDFKSDDRKSSWKYNGNEITGECQPIEEIDFPIVVLKINFGGNFQPFEQPFYSQSLYNLKPVVESFYEDIKYLLNMIYSPVKLA